MAQSALARLPINLFQAVIVCVLAVMLFRTYPWFRVEHRRAWRTAFREAWWACAISATLGLVVPLAMLLVAPAVP